MSFILKDIIIIITIVVMGLSLTFSIRKCSQIEEEYETNMKAVKESLVLTENKNGELVASTKAYEATIKDLKGLNNDLYEEVASLKKKCKDIENAIKVEGEIVNEIHDTTYVVKYDTITHGFEHEFDFSNEWRQLCGNVSYLNDSLNLSIDKDIVQFSYVVAMDENNNIYIKSSNPYVQYKSLTGFSVPQQKQKRWSIGPSVGYGYNNYNGWQWFFGVTLNYGLIRF